MSHRGLPILDLSLASDPNGHDVLLQQLREALLIPASYILRTVDTGYAEETTLNEKDLREQIDFATDLSVIWEQSGSVSSESSESNEGRDFSKVHWHVRGPNQWPPETEILEYHNTFQPMSYRFIHLMEEGLGECLSLKRRIKLVGYPPGHSNEPSQAVGAHKDSSGWLTFLYPVGQERGLGVLDTNSEWVAAPPVKGTFVVNFGNAFEAATESVVKATVHRVKVLAPGPESNRRCSIPFFQRLPLDLTISEIRPSTPEDFRNLRQNAEHLRSCGDVSSFPDSRWDRLGESQLRKWFRSHGNVGRT
ncbi:Clavaminate synthase-like protein [Delitschia confertaspora ATCC 74209]|uniref:Clavaminate synthase-like protein n=1 Tax=Delitschia confertaspora ATCC 74209 TaxID=1513339 RepID=A0A9P4JU61_9PLEO|nr:Clavaminate synthase-like protein [Delitschia confertaspora ATCC 74209]